MWMKALAGAALMAAVGLSGGCANDANLLGEGLSTASITPVAKKQPSVDPQCVTLVSKIDALRKEGTPERIEKVSTGKSKTAVVKRESLQRITELDKANAEFQARCSTMPPGEQAAAATAPTPAAGVAQAAATDAAKAAATKAATSAATDAAKKVAVKTVAKQAPKAAAAAAGVQ